MDAADSIEKLPVPSDSEEQDNEEINKEQVDVNFSQPESPSEYLRLLSRSESAGDANIIDKLQQNTKKHCSRTLQFNGDQEDKGSNKNSPSK